jgi:hypothetical protein
MGLFNRGKQERQRADEDRARRERQEQLFTGHIVPNPVTRGRMKPIPNYRDVATQAIALSGKPAQAVNLSEVTGQVSMSVVNMLQKLCPKVGLDWDDMIIVLGRQDFTTDILSDYLSTCGMAGPMINDRISEQLSEFPQQLSRAIVAGRF